MRYVFAEGHPIRPPSHGPTEPELVVTHVIPTCSFLNPLINPSINRPPLEVDFPSLGEWPISLSYIVMHPFCRLESTETLLRVSSVIDKRFIL